MRGGPSPRRPVQAAQAITSPDALGKPAALPVAARPSTRSVAWVRTS